MNVKVLSLSIHILQGVIYSPTAAANYKSDDVFDMYVDNIPARRVGYPEEVSTYR